MKGCCRLDVASKYEFWQTIHSLTCWRQRRCVVPIAYPNSSIKNFSSTQLFSSWIFSFIRNTSLSKHSAEFEIMAVPWIRRLGAGFSLRRLGFDPRTVSVEVVLYKLRLEKVFFPITSTSYSFVTDITSIRITVEVSSLVKCNARAHTHTHTHTHTQIRAHW